MKLGLEFIDHNQYPFCGVFIKGASPEVWIREISKMQLKIDDCTMYPCPGSEANVIAGILLISEKINRKTAVSKHRYVQQVYSQVYIPENTEMTVDLLPEEVTTFFKGQPHFLHHELGLIELKETLSWENMLKVEGEMHPDIVKPVKGISIPAKIVSYSIEVDEKEEEKLFKNPFEEKGSEEDLPFDMKKVLRGNNKEIEKYLNYLKKNPDAALKMAIPLDMLGTSRGKAYANYKFGKSTFNLPGFSIFSGLGGNGAGILSIIGVALLVLIVVILVVKGSMELSNGSAVDENGFIWILPLIGLGLIAGVFFFRKKIQRNWTKSQKKKMANWKGLSDDSELFEFDEESSPGFYFGGDELSFIHKFLTVLFLSFLLLYIFYPLVAGGTTANIFAVILGVSVLRILYTLVRRDKDFSDDE